MFPGFSEVCPRETFANAKTAAPIAAICSIREVIFLSACQFRFDTVCRQTGLLSTLGFGTDRIARALFVPNHKERRYKQSVCPSPPHWNIYGNRALVNRIVASQTLVPPYLSVVHPSCRLLFQVFSSAASSPSPNK